MNIVLVNHYAGGQSFGMEFRPYYLAREWVRAGHNVKIVAATFAHLRSKQPRVTSDITQETVDGVDYIWIRTNSYQGNGLRRILSMIRFTWGLYFKLNSVLTTFKPDLFIASSTYPFDSLPLSRLSRKWRARLCFEVHDLWPLSPIEFGGFSRHHPFIMAVQWAEDFAYRNADFVVSLLPKAKDYMVSRGMKPEKFVYVPNGIVIEDWRHVKPMPDAHAKLLEEVRTRFKFLVGYAGSHGIANSLISLVEAAKYLDQGYAIVFVGDGPEKKSLMDEAQAQGMSNIFFLPPVSKQSIPSLLAPFDALYVAFQKQSLLRFGISPNKMFDYMMAKKPIIQAIDAGNNIVEDYSCGVAVEPENPKSIAKGIVELAAMSAEERRKLGENGHNAVLKYHDFSVLCQQFLDAANQVNSPVRN